MDTPMSGKTAFEDAFAKHLQEEMEVVPSGQKGPQSPTEQIVTARAPETMPLGTMPVPTIYTVDYSAQNGRFSGVPKYAQIGEAFRYTADPEGLLWVVVNVTENAYYLLHPNNKGGTYYLPKDGHIGNFMHPDYKDAYTKSSATMSKDEVENLESEDSAVVQLDGISTKGDAPDPLAGELGKGKEIPRTVLQMDLWGMDRGKKLLEEYKESPVQELLKKINYDDKSMPAEVMADLHAAAYEPDPVVNEESVDLLRHEFIKTLLESSDFQSLRTSTVLNPNAAELAAMDFGKNYLELVQKEIEREAAAGKRKKPGSSKEQQEQEEKDQNDQANNVMRAAQQSLRDAQQSVDEYDDVAKSFGKGGGGFGSQDMHKTKQLFKKVRKSDMLKKVAELAGRYRRAAQGKQRSKAVHGVDEVVDIELGHEFDRVLPEELSKLADEDLELDVMRRMSEEQLRVRRTRAVQKVAKGPIVIAVDESGSMDGQPIWNAKAFALAMAWIAQKQKRPCLLVGWSDGREGTTSMLLPDTDWEVGRKGQLSLVEWLEHFFGNGTDYAIPLEVVPKHWSTWNKEGLTRGKTDMIILTDGQCNLPEPMKKMFLKFKENEQVRLITIAVGSDAGALRQVSDEVHQIQTISVESEAIQAAFSI